MFQTLYKQSRILARYREGPLSDARERFIEQCAERGYSRSMLRKISWVLLAVAHSIDIEHGNVTAHDIELAVDRRRRFNRSANHSRVCRESRDLFIRFATRWVRSLDCLAANLEEERPFAAEIAAFANYLREERGLSEITISSRCERVFWFVEGLHPPRKTLDTISIVDVDRFIKAKSDQGWMRSSLASLASSLRSFFRYAESQSWCTRGIGAVIESPRLYAQEGLPKGPSWEDVQHLLESTRGDSTADIRNHAILILLAVYGLRRGEVARLELEDVDWTDEQLVVTRPKQRRVVRYPLLPCLGEAIVRYLREVRPRCTHRSLFLTMAAPIRPLSAASITHIARSRLSALGVSSPGGAHCLRHACASHLLASGFSLKQIGDHLGHRSASSTLSYTKVDIVGLRQVAELDLGRLL